jgi:hypothetical protein
MAVENYECKFCSQTLGGEKSNLSVGGTESFSIQDLGKSFIGGVIEMRGVISVTEGIGGIRSVTTRTVVVALLKNEKLFIRIGHYY